MKDPKYKSILLLKTGLFLFWITWFTLFFFTNFTNLLKDYGYLPTNWKFNSRNYYPLFNVIGVYRVTPAILNTLFYIDMIVLEGGIIFLIAFIQFIQQALSYWFWINFSFILIIELWVVFVLLERVFITYSFEATHICFVIFELISLIVMHVLLHHMQHAKQQIDPQHHE